MKTDITIEARKSAKRRETMTDLALNMQNV